MRHKFQASIPGTFSAYQPSFTQCPGLESVTVLVGASLIEQSREAGEKGRDDILFLDEAWSFHPRKK